MKWPCSLVAYLMVIGAICSGEVWLRRRTIYLIHNIQTAHGETCGISRKITWRRKQTIHWKRLMSSNALILNMFSIYKCSAWMFYFLSSCRCASSPWSLRTVSAPANAEWTEVKTWKILTSLDIDCSRPMSRSAASLTSSKEPQWFQHCHAMPPYLQRTLAKLYA